jgi:hypothetical protein
MLPGHKKFLNFPGELFCRRGNNDGSDAGSRSPVVSTAQAAHISSEHNPFRKSLTISVIFSGYAIESKISEKPGCQF